MNFHYKKVIEHDIKINFEAIIATWKKIIAGYTIENEEEIDYILDDAFTDVLYYPPTEEKANYFLIDEDEWDIREIDGYYGTDVADFCENTVAEYLQYWGLLY